MSRIAQSYGRAPRSQADQDIGHQLTPEAQTERDILGLVALQLTRNGPAHRRSYE
jgi:hypothetical protein